MKWVLGRLLRFWVASWPAKGGKIREHLWYVGYHDKLPWSCLGKELGILCTFCHTGQVAISESSVAHRVVPKELHVCFCYTRKV